MLYNKEFQNWLLIYFHKRLLNGFCKEHFVLFTPAPKFGILSLVKFKLGQVLGLGTRQYFSSMQVQPDIKLPVLYLVDSIIKNVGGAYTQKFSQIIVNMFTKTFKQVNISPPNCNIAKLDTPSC